MSTHLWSNMWSWILADWSSCAEKSMCISTPHGKWHCFFSRPQRILWALAFVGITWQRGESKRCDIQNTKSCLQDSSSNPSLECLWTVLFSCIFSFFPWFSTPDRTRAKHPVQNVQSCCLSDLHSEVSQSDETSQSATCFETFWRIGVQMSTVSWSHWRVGSCWFFLFDLKIPRHKDWDPNFSPMARRAPANKRPPAGLGRDSWQRVPSNGNHIKIWDKEIKRDKHILKAYYETIHNEFDSASHVHSLPWISWMLGNFMHMSESSRCPQLLRSGVLSPQVRESTRQNMPCRICQGNTALVPPHIWQFDKHWQYWHKVIQVDFELSLALFALHWSSEDSDTWHFEHPPSN